MELGNKQGATPLALAEVQEEELRNPILGYRLPSACQVASHISNPTPPAPFPLPSPRAVPPCLRDRCFEPSHGET